ncbi:MAG: molybdopterin-guanine dinucleotide biosynthesis protein MobB [Spirochaetes bacterium]|nr:molybdopterin-guanine dinucleotide biosynthesis protein MobB [Spirochaetota bacterium]
MKIQPRILSFIGYSNTGKTSFIEELLRECAVRGILAATVKKSRHGADLVPGVKDSERFYAAGASPSIYLDEKSMLVLSLRPAGLDADGLAALCPGADLILCEGLELPGCPLVLVAGKAIGEWELKHPLAEASALIGGGPSLAEAAAGASIPRFSSGDAPRFLDWLSLYSAQE